jgi:hypothetical protein
MGQSLTKQLLDFQLPNKQFLDVHRTNMAKAQESHQNSVQDLQRKLEEDIGVAMGKLSQCLRICFDTLQKSFSEAMRCSAEIVSQSEQTAS